MLIIFILIIIGIIVIVLTPVLLYNIDKSRRHDIEINGKHVQYSDISFISALSIMHLNSYFTQDNWVITLEDETIFNARFLRLERGDEVVLIKIRFGHGWLLKKIYHQHMMNDDLDSDMPLIRAILHKKDPRKEALMKQFKPEVVDEYARTRNQSKTN